MHLNKALFFGFFFMVIYGFNWSKCKKSEPVKSEGVGWQSVAFTQISNWAVSTTEFASSTGDCSAIGNNESESKVFIRDNYESLMTDISKGSGEYIFAYAKIHGCESFQQKIYANRMKSKYFLLSNKSPATHGEDIYAVLESPFKKGFLGNTCKFTD